jgi:hypothetical protein
MNPEAVFDRRTLKAGIVKEIFDMLAANTALDAMGSKHLVRHNGGSNVFSKERACSFVFYNIAARNDFGSRYLFRRSS